jgi:hypothetical protein
VAKWEDIRKTAVCKSCGASLADKLKKSKFCSLKCCGIDKIGKAREDCRKYKTCKACGKTGFGVSFCGYGRDVCADCYKPTEGPKKRFQCIRCGDIGFGVKFAPPSSRGRCCKCWGDDKERNKLKAAAMLLRPCKVCGKAIGTNDKRQVVCSRNCAFQNLRKGRIEVKCCNCGKSVFRYEAALKIRSVFSCSLKCQRQYALVKNHSTASKVDWLSKSADAKARWRRLHSKNRLRKNKWIFVIRKWQKNKDQTRDPWADKCKSASALLKERAFYRPENVFCLESPQWNEIVLVQVKLVKLKGERCTMSEWKKKSDSVARNIKNRFRF